MLMVETGLFAPAERDEIAMVENGSKVSAATSSL